MTHADLTRLVHQGLAALDQGKTQVALDHFETAAPAWPTALVLSCLGYCLARERNEIDRGLDLCRKALRDEPANPVHYLNLGRVYLLARQKGPALGAFRRGLRFAEHPGLLKEINRLGRRRAPLFPFLAREHALNRCCGLLLRRLRLR
ncbi:hypothetical protein DESUT3_14840 [Desulfuromonas versatilis]|uniref:Tetratricopeptide repeat protein n=1 Tax=Desulfuromonas versatilis TaxID=2802975 RepID=A0ABM8HTQ5_9BACT|nr:hypothetical protein [Desulfuromonas versatilis]BCR04415.1 hypothetical protein DESUT3_14840 [Desulfuromonas versatilis]